jgi:hypothetical protein
MWKQEGLGAEVAKASPELGKREWRRGTHKSIMGLCPKFLS